LIAGLVLSTSSPAVNAESTPPSPSHMVAFFPDTACPEGWSSASYLHGRAPLAVSSPAATPTQVGSAMANISAPTHQHDYQGSINLPGKSLTGD
jgi:hypothetical protein